MQSDDKLPETPPTEVADLPTSSSTRVEPLRREAMMVATERQNHALFAALFSLAGVGFGFGLSQLANANSTCHHQVTVQHQETRSAMPAPSIQTAPAPVAKLTWLGVEGHSAGGGAYVTKVFPGSPAEAAGLEDGDTIMAVDHQRISSFGDLIVEVRNHDKGERAILRYETLSGAMEASVVTFGDISRREFRHLANR
jgi:PDZ domain-containing secreted protein